MGEIIAGKEATSDSSFQSSLGIANPQRFPGTEAAFV
jgi:hypothetical protein